MGNKYIIDIADQFRGTFKQWVLKPGPTINTLGKPGITKKPYIVKLYHNASAVNIFNLKPPHSQIDLISINSSKFQNY